MTSAINPNYPSAGNATTQSVRDNFAAAKSEIEALQLSSLTASFLGTTGAAVDVVSAAPPTTGQVLKATSATTATWQNDNTGGTVTDVSVASANGFTGTVATSTTTPVITLTTSVTGLLKGNGTAVSAASSGTDYAPATSGSSILKGNGAGGFSNAAAGTDYAPATSGSAILKGNGAGGFSSAAAGTDYVAPGSATTSGITMAADRLLGRTTATPGAIEEISVAGTLTLVGGVLTGTGGSGTVTAVSVASANGFAGSSSGGATPALTLTTSISGLLKGNGTAISAASAGTDYAPATSGSSILKGNGSGGFSNATAGTDYAPASGIAANLTVVNSPYITFNFFGGM